MKVFKRGGLDCLFKILGLLTDETMRGFVVCVGGDEWVYLFIDRDAPRAFHLAIFYKSDKRIGEVISAT